MHDKWYVFKLNVKIHTFKVTEWNFTLKKLFYLKLKLHFSDKIVT